MLRTLALMTLVAVGCQPAPAVPKKAATPAPLGAAFDAKTCGAIQGRVTWDGPIPAIDPIPLLVKVEGFDLHQPNPNAPRINSKDLGMGQSLVFLRKVDLAKSKPWPFGAAEIAFEQNQLLIRQDGQTGRLGLVRQATDITCISREKRKHILLGRGDGFFSLPLVDAEKPTKRTLDQSGIVELSSGAAFYWLRAYLWVSDHPYAAITDASGAFTLTQVPAGEYEIVSWNPNWHIAATERHPEFGEIERLIFAKAVEQATTVRVQEGETAKTDFTWSVAAFKK